MEEQLLEHIKLQRPPLILCVTAGTMLILSALQFTLAGTAQKHVPVNSHAVYTPIQLPPAAKSLKLQSNPFLAPAAPDIKRQTAALTPVLKGTVQNGSTTMATMLLPESAAREASTSRTWPSRTLSVIPFA